MCGCVSVFIICFSFSSEKHLLLKQNISTDLVMIIHNLKHTDEQKILEQALEDNKGILIKKAFASGNLINSNIKNPIGASFNFIFKNPSVSSIIIGTLNAFHMKDNVEKAILALER